MGTSESVRNAVKRYNAKCKYKMIAFYPNKKDTDLYEYCNTINFQGEVKKFLVRKKRRAEKDNLKEKKGE